jgi:hypothetical protein
MKLLTTRPSWGCMRGTVGIEDPGHFDFDTMLAVDSRRTAVPAQRLPSS